MESGEDGGRDFRARKSIGRAQCKAWKAARMEEETSGRGSTSAGRSVRRGKRRGWRKRLQGAEVHRPLPDSRVCDRYS
ncbi:MAG: hypothetical protein LBI42_00590 [Chitinispirillales bacterium]|nr:hypothetical protein [Chitinispirillales bacterium]